MIILTWNCLTHVQDLVTFPDVFLLLALITTFFFQGLLSYEIVNVMSVLKGESMYFGDLGAFDVESETAEHMNSDWQTDGLAH